jgi:hypothetical protein
MNSPKENYEKAYTRYDILQDRYVYEKDEYDKIIYELDILESELYPDYETEKKIDATRLKAKKAYDELEKTSKQLYEAQEEMEKCKSEYEKYKPFSNN